MASTQSIRIGIDAMVTPTLRTGIGRYVDNLVRHLASEAPYFDYIVFHGSNQEDLAGKFPTAIEGVRSRFSTERPILNFLRMQLITPLVSKRLRLDLLHVPNEKLIFFKSCPLVLTIHDIGDRRVARRHGFLRRLYRRIALRHMLNKADHLIAVSQATANDLVELCDVPPSRITVIAEGVSDDLVPVPLVEARSLVSSRWKAEGSYVLFVGELATRKNLSVLISAFGHLITQVAPETKLILVGRDAGARDAILKQVAGTPVEERLVMTGHVTDAELAALYSAASLLVLPSVYEGFGLPVLEAMACGIPVIAANVGSLPEVVGTAGLLADCTDPAALYIKMASVMTDASLRERMTRLGLEHVKKYSWAEAARRTAAVYARVAAAGVIQ